MRTLACRSEGQVAGMEVALCRKGEAEEMYMTSALEITPDVAVTATKVTAEFREMPGMRLTEPQVKRLWSLSPAECDAVLGYLVDRGELARDPAGRYRLPRSPY